MVDSTKKPAARKAAAKPAAARKPAARSTAPRAADKAPAGVPEEERAAPAARTTAAAAPAPAEGTAVIRFEKEKSGRRGVVRGGVNGQKFEFPVGKDVIVTEAQLNVLRDSGETFTTVTPLAGEGADEGSSAPSTVTGTATRLEPVEPKNAGIGEDGQAQTPELRQITDEELTHGTDQKASQEQAEGDGGSAGDGGDTGTKPTGEMKPAK